MHSINRDIGSLFGESKRDGAADPLTGSRYQGDLSH
jgi:hypothetical protein